jgi:hypothetical protein
MYSKQPLYMYKDLWNPIVPSKHLKKKAVAFFFMF